LAIVGQAVCVVLFIDNNIGRIQQKKNKNIPGLKRCISSPVATASAVSHYCNGWYGVEVVMIMFGCIDVVVSKFVFKKTYTEGPNNGKLSLGPCYGTLDGLVIVVVISCCWPRYM
jgi:hypothetical protein